MGPYNSAGHFLAKRYENASWESKEPLSVNALGNWMHRNRRAKLIKGLFRVPTVRQFKHLGKLGYYRCFSACKNWVLSLTLKWGTLPRNHLHKNLQSPEHLLHENWGLSHFDSYPPSMMPPWSLTTKGLCSPSDTQAGLEPRRSRVSASPAKSMSNGQVCELGLLAQTAVWATYGCMKSWQPVLLQHTCT